MSSMEIDDGPPSADYKYGHVDESEGDQQPAAEVQVEDSQYYETSTSRNVPTKTGDGDIVNETQFDDERPSSAGTGRSIPLETDDTETLERLTATPSVREITPAAERHFTNQIALIDRPQNGLDPKPEVSFSFAKANRPHMDFTGTRKGPATIMPSDSAHAENSGELQSSKTRDTEQNRTDHQRQDQSLESGQSRHNAAGANEHALQTQQHARNDTPKKKSKKRKKSVKKGEEIGLPGPSGFPENIAADYAVEGRTGPDDAIEPHLSIETDDVAAEKSQQRQRTPVDLVAQESRLEVDSPHTQLQYEMQVATVDPNPEAHDQLPPAQDEPMMEYDTAQASRAPSVSEQHAAPQVNDRDSIRPADTMEPASERVTSMRASKRKQKKNRTSMTPSVQAAGSAKGLNSDVNDYLQILAYKIHQNEQSSSVKFEAELGSLQAELQQVLEAKDLLQNELSQSLHEKNALSSTVDKQAIKVATYEAKIKKFKSFVDGLGNDVNALKKQADSSRAKIETLVQHGKEQKQERERLAEQLTSWSERSTELQRETSQTCGEMESALHGETVRSNYLERQLSEKVGVLSEERDRRSKLENQLASAMSSDKKAFDMFQSTSTKVLEKLSAIHGSFNERCGDTNVADILKQTFAAVQSLDSRTTTTMDGLTSVKALVRNLQESITARSEDDRNDNEGASAIASTFQEQLDNTLKKLVEESGRREILNEQNESIRTLQDKVDRCNVRLGDAQAQITKAQNVEHKLKEENDALKKEILTIQHPPSPARTGQTHSKDAAREVEHLRSQLASKTDELKTSSTSNSHLREELTGLQVRLKEAQDTLAALRREHEDLQRGKKEEVEQMNRQTKQFEIELKTQVNNDFKKLKSERDRFGKQLEPLKEELSNCKAQIEQLKKENSKSSTSSTGEVEMLSKTARSQKEEIDALKASLRSDLNLREKYSSLSTELNIEKGKLQESVEQKSALTRQMEDLQRATDDAKLVGEQSKSELAKTRIDKENAVQELRKELADANQSAERAAAGLEHFKESCKKAIDDAKDKGERQVEALQERLAEAQSELQKSKSEDEKFRSDIERTWQQEQQNFEEKTSEIKQKMMEAEAQRDEALSNNERLRKELQDAMNEQRDTLLAQLDQLQQRAVTAEEKLQSQQQRSGEKSQDSLHMKVPSIREGITPTNSIHSKEPTKPRKKVNRNENVVVEASAIPAPEELRPDSRKTNSAGKREVPRPSIVEDSQVVSDPFAVQSFQDSHGASKLNYIPTFSDDDILSVKDGSRPGYSSHARNDTQDDSLPSFAAFNANLRPTYTSVRHVPSSVYSAQDRPVIDQDKSRDQPEHFTIYEDSQNEETLVSQGDSEARRQLRDTLAWSPSEMDKYTFHRARPTPNRASKMIHRDDREIARAKRNGSDTHHRTSSKGRVQTPKASDESKGALNGTLPGLYRHEKTSSSSPDFVQQNADSARKLSTYNSGGGSGGKRRVSRKRSTEVGDPRLANRVPQQATKRKAEGHIIEGYEHERKKRPNAAANTSRNDERHLSLRSQTQTLPSGQTQFQTLTSSTATSKYDGTSSSSQSRMRTLAGGNTRTTRGTKKLSKNDEFNARFSKELDRPGR